MMYIDSLPVDGVSTLIGRLCDWDRRIIPHNDLDRLSDKSLVAYSDYLPRFAIEDVDGCGRAWIWRKDVDDRIVGRVPEHVRIGDICVRPMLFGMSRSDRIVYREVVRMLDGLVSTYYSVICVGVTLHFQRCDEAWIDIDGVKRSVDEWIRLIRELKGARAYVTKIEKEKRWHVHAIVYFDNRNSDVRRLGGICGRIWREVCGGYWYLDHLDSGEGVRVGWVCRLGKLRVDDWLKICAHLEKIEYTLKGVDRDDIGKGRKLVRYGVCGDLEGWDQKRG